MVCEVGREVHGVLSEPTVQGALSLDLFFSKNLILNMLIRTREVLCEGFGCSYRIVWCVRYAR